MVLYCGDNGIQWKRDNDATGAEGYAGKRWTANTTIELKLTHDVCENTWKCGELKLLPVRRRTCMKNKIKC